MRGSLIVAVLLSVLLIIFAITNNYNVEVNLLATRITVSMPILLISTFALGVLTAFLFSIPSWWRRRKEKNAHVKQIQQLNQEITTLKKDINESAVDDFVKDVDNE